MTSYLGPETPRPFSVISEKYVDELKIPKIPECSDRSFGETYEKKMCELIHRYLELDTHERLCYVGDVRGGIAPMIQERFCLLEPVLTVAAGNFHFEETDTDKLIAFKVAYTGAEEYFENLYTKTESRDLQPGLKNRVKTADDDVEPLFDKMILHNATGYFQNPKDTYKNIMKSVTQDGKMLIIHRALNLNTLPYFNEAKERIKQTESPYIDIVRDLQSCGFDVQWQIELVPAVMPKMQWLSMVKDKFPCQLEVVSNCEIMEGIRELSEGMLKYNNGVVEFVDRLLFITVSLPPKKIGIPTLQRHGQSQLFPRHQDELRYIMEVTPELKEYAERKKVKPRRRLELAFMD